MAEITSPILELQRQQLLLTTEYDEERAAFEEMSRRRGLGRSLKRGDSWWPVKFTRSYYNSLNQLCVEIIRTPSAAADDIDHNFEYGRPVAFFTADGADGSEAEKLRAAAAQRGREKGARDTEKLGFIGIKGTVSYVDGDRMVVCIPDGTATADLARDGLGVQLSFDETSYRMMFDALERTIRAKGRLGYLRDLFYSPTQKAATFSFPDIALPYLNVTQQHAVNEVLRAKDVSIVHGPPGTGKTTTLVEAIYETLRREPQVLVCAQSNTAVDWIAEKLVDRGLNVLRIGNPTRVDDKMLAFTYERRFEAHPDYPELWAVRKAIREVRANRRRGDAKWHQKMERLRDRATALEIAIRQQLFGEARVVACTLVGSGHRLLDGMKFSTLFIDEAAQAMEAACWIAIRRAGRVVLAGDHCQLPPTVKSYEALRGGLGITLMERIAQQKPEVVTLLRVQYRMHEDIMRFSSDWFYHNMVESAPEVRYRSILDLDLPMTWIRPVGEVDSDEPSHEEFVGESFGRINRSEARLTLLTLRAYFEMIGKQRILNERLDVGIISPYRAQVQLLRQMVRQEEFFRPFRQLISVNTVDGFQGQERDIIIISLVRSNDDGQIGFLRDLRRMNVAITRARMKVIILGDPDTLCRHPFYRRLYRYIEALR